MLPHISPGAMLSDAERARLATLRRYRILDPQPEQAFDDLALLASQICGTPMALITLVDAERQWFKARIGLSSVEIARSASFCAHAMRQRMPFVIPTRSRTLVFARIRSWSASRGTRRIGQSSNRARVAGRQDVSALQDHGRRRTSRCRRQRQPRITICPLAAPIRSAATDSGSHLPRCAVTS
jgi:hypothetical protein